VSAEVAVVSRNVSCSRKAALAAGALTITLVFSGCGKKPDVGAPPAAFEVKAITVEPSSTITHADKVGEVRGSQEVELRPRVSGILLSKHFEDGALVEEGQLLFSIDAREYRAQMNSAKAQLASAEANLYRARQDVARYKPLLADEAIARQVYDNAVATANQAQAQVDASRAALQEAELGVEYAEVRSPLHGRIGAAQVFAGGLVQAGTTVLATLSSDDPAWVYFSISEAELLNFEKSTGGRTVAADDPRRQVQLLLSDGSVYGQPGRINFNDRALDPATGTYKLRAEFPNPEHKLMPGLFARIRATGDRLDNALVVPDRAVQEQLGRYFLTVVDKDDKAEMRPVTLGPRFGNRQVIQSGLQPGDRVVVEGIQKARPGTPLKVIAVTLEDFDAAKQAAAPDASASNAAATGAT
jgi:membrane fusion protein (multidrug efflux system)